MRLTAPRSPVWVFHHIPKCAGTSVRKVLANWFVMVGDYRKGFSLEYPPAVDLSSLRSVHCLAGHFELEGYHLHQRYPAVLQSSRFRVFTFLRDPLDARISDYYYLRKKNQPLGNVPLREHILRSKNWFASILSCDETNYEEVLGRYFFIGIVEDLQRSVDLLAKLTGRDFVRVPNVNSSERDLQQNELSEADRRLFRERNQLDYAIYDYAVRRFRSIADSGSNLEIHSKGV
ncbi:MAG TPA: hypothetical protein VM534_03340 [Thermoanaerobaculia bacterium]|nr:hypothetical protein [Thermoanaerobaculia bacterium]